MLSNLISELQAQEGWTPLQRKAWAAGYTRAQVEDLQGMIAEPQDCFLSDEQWTKGKPPFTGDRVTVHSFYDVRVLVEAWDIAAVNPIVSSRVYTAQKVFSGHTSVPPEIVEYWGTEIVPTSNDLVHGLVTQVKLSDLVKTESTATWRLTVINDNEIAS